MAQHLLIADLAAPLMLVGLRNPVLAFFLPAPCSCRSRAGAAAPQLPRRCASRSWRCPIYVLVLYGWHFTLFFEAAVRNPLVHVAPARSSSASACSCGGRCSSPSAAGCAASCGRSATSSSARFLGMFLGMGFVLIRVPIYTGVYGSGERARARAAIGRPADRRRDDGRARHLHHGLRARASSSGAPAQQDDRAARQRGRARRARALLDGELAFHAALAVAGDRAVERVLAGLEVDVDLRAPPFWTTAPFSSTPLPSIAMLWSIEDSFLELIVDAPAGASAAAELVGERAVGSAGIVERAVLALATSVDFLTPTVAERPLSSPGLAAA